MKIEKFMMSLIGLHKLADLIFGITQKTYILTYQTWSSNTIF